MTLGRETPVTSQTAAQPGVTIEQVIVTGSNIPTAEEVGPNPVDTYRPADIQKLGIRNTTDLTTFLPQEAGGTVNLNGTRGDGTVQFNLRGLLGKETLVLVDGKRVAFGSLNSGGFSGGVDINLIPFPMIDHIDILKDGASAVYGSDAVAGGVFSRDRDISSNAFQRPWGGFDARDTSEPGRVRQFRLLPKMFFGPGGLPQFGVNTPLPHSAPNVQTSPYYVHQYAVPTYPHGDFFFLNYAPFTSALPPADRQAFYGSFTRDLCDKYLVLFADFKYVRSFFDASLAAVPFGPNPFETPGTNEVSDAGTISVPLQNPFNPFTVADATLVINGVPTPVTRRVFFRGINDTGPSHEKFTYWDSLFDVGLRGEMGEFGDYFKTWNWEAGFRYSRNEGQHLSIGDVSQPGLRDALLDTNPATAFDPFLNFTAHNTRAARSRVYVNLQNSGQFELPLGYATINGELFNLPAGPVSFAIGGEYRGERWTRDRDPLTSTFQSIGSNGGQGARVNRDVWGIYEEVRVPFTSPTWNFPAFYSFEIGFAEREEWYSQNTSAVPPSGVFPFQPAAHSQYNAQKPKVSVRWQPLDPKWIGALTLRGSYTEAFHAPNLSEISPASSQGFPNILVDPFSGQTIGVEERAIGNPNLHSEVAYEWSYGAVYSPKWIKGLTLSADWWHIDLRSIASFLGAQF